MSNFDKVKEFNEAFDVPQSENIQRNILEENPTLVKRRLALINEETCELNEAIKQNNFTEVIDALADILYVVYGAGASFGINLDHAYDIVHKSNMSKLCKTEEEAKETVEWYKNEYNSNSGSYDSPTYIKVGKYYKVYNESTGKVLKNVHYTPANFESLK